MMYKKWSEVSSYGKLMVLIGILVIVPLLGLPYYSSDSIYIVSFLIPSILSIGLGSVVCVFGRKDAVAFTSWQQNLFRSSMIVLFSWLWGVFIGALPFVLAGQLTFVQGLFEAVSGWTTTGLSVMDVTKTPMIFLFFRSWMQYCGGMGFVLMMILLITNKNSMLLYHAEGHPDTILPTIKKTAWAIFAVYNICLVLGTISYVVVGMSVFDAICHAMCSLSTGGFSTKLNSIGEYDSFMIEVVTIVLMVIGTTNFAALLLLAKGKIKEFFHVSEVKTMFWLFIIFIPMVAWNLMGGLQIDMWEALRKASFDVISALSTTGYSTMSYQSWPEFSIAILILMMFIGGGIGSTAGGLKISRVYLLLKIGVCHVMNKMVSNHKVDVMSYQRAVGKTVIDDEVKNETFSFFIWYFVIYCIGSLLVVLCADCRLLEGMFEFASSLGTVGLSIGITNPFTNDATLIVEMIGMFVGRLEIFVVFIGIWMGFQRLFTMIHQVLYDSKMRVRKFFLQYR